MTVSNMTHAIWWKLVSSYNNKQMVWSCVYCCAHGAHAQNRKTLSRV